MISLDFGTVVQSTAGRDRHRVFLVIDIDYSDMVRPVIVANGQLRKFSGKKHKNPRHLKFIAKLTEEEICELSSDLSDEKILIICKKYDKIQK